MMSNDLGTTKTIHIGLTGHRPPKLWGYNIDKPEYDRLQDKLEEIIESLLTEYDQVVGHSGLALGADTVWSIAILNMREKYPNRVKFHAEIPFWGQPSTWYEGDASFWDFIVTQADEHTLYLETEPGTKWETISKWVISRALDDRNKGMVDHVDILIAIFDNTPSGTKNAVEYAKKKSKYLLTYHPNDFKK